MENLIVETAYDITGKLYKIKNTNNWYYYFRHANKTHRSSTHTSDPKQAKIFLSNLIADTYNGTPKTKRTKGGNVITFAKMAAIFIQEQNLKTETTPPTLSKRTIKDYNAWMKMAVKYFGEYTEADFMKLESITIWTEYISWRKDYWKGKENERVVAIRPNGKKQLGRHKTFTVGPVQINKEIHFIRQVLGYFQSYKGLFKGYTIPLYSKKSPYYQKELPRKVFIETWEYDAMKDYFSKDPIKYHYIRFLMNTGIRPLNEALSLTVDCVDYKHDLIHFRNRKSKNGEKRQTPFPMIGKVRHIVDDILETTKEAREKAKPEHRNLLFLNPDGSPLGYMCAALRNCIAEHKMNQKIPLYSFRHTFALKMVKQNQMPLFILAKLMGNSVDMIERQYVEYRGQDGIEAMKRVYEEIAMKQERYSKLREQGLID